jgi:dTMP kinase
MIFRPAACSRSAYPATIRDHVFIVFEGVEGSGKSTQARLLSEALARQGVAHVLTREPGGTQIGEEIRRALLHSGADVPARTELLLMLAARAAFVDHVVKPALARNEVVIADRYELSSLAYQGHGRGLGVEAVKRANAFATGGLAPDLTIVLDVPVSEGVARRAKAGGEADRIERAGADFHERVAGAYRLLSNAESGVELVSGSGDAGEVHAAVMAVLSGRFPETFRIEQG